MKSFNKLISLLAAASMLSASVVLPASAAKQAEEAANTPLTVFCDTFENRETESFSLFDTGDATFEDDIWEIANPESSDNQYSIVNSNGNNAIALTPTDMEGSELCVLSTKDDISFLGDYIVSADISTDFGKVTSTAGIRLSHPYDNTCYYELALIIIDGVCQPRFTKVEGASPNELADESKWKYHEFGETFSASDSSSLEVFLAKKDNTVYYSVINNPTGKTLWFGSFEDSTPVYDSFGKLQLFAFSADEDSTSVLFDHTCATRLGSKLYRDNNSGKIALEVAWPGNSHNPPLIAVADYDENNRLLGVQRFGANEGYYLYNDDLTLCGTEAKLFVWDGTTNQPIYDVAVYEDTSVYQVPAEEYVLQYNLPSSLTFVYGGGIHLKTLGTVRVSESAELYVNGCRYFGQYDYYGNPVITNEILDKFLGNAQGNIKFVRSDPASTKYDRIYVDYYEVGKVTAVSYDSYGETSIAFTPATDAPYSNMKLASSCTIKISDDAVDYGETEIYVEKNKSEIQLKDLSVGDTIAVATNFEGQYYGANFLRIVNPDFIRVLATDKTITGMVLDYDDNNGTYTIGENTYRYVGYTPFALDIAATYELNLDPFGRILDDGEIVSLVSKYAIVEKYNANTEKVSMLLADGSTASYEIHPDSPLGAETIYSFIYANGTSGALNPVQYRVVTYTTTGDRAKLTQALPYLTISAKEYNPNTGKIGSVTINDELNIINAQQHEEASSPSISDYEKFDVADFKADVEYDGFAYKTGSKYEFLIITRNGTTFTEDSRFAVITKDPMSKIYDGETCVGVDALYKGEAITLYWDSQTPSEVPYGEGDIIYFTTDSEGYVKSAYKIYDRETGNFTAEYTFRTMPAGSYMKDDWNFSFSRKDIYANADIQLVKGYVTEVKSNSITFGVVSNGIADHLTGILYDNVIDGTTYEKYDGSAGMFTFGISSDCQAYIFDGAYEVRPVSRKYSVIDSSAIPESTLIEVRDANNNSVDDIYSASDSILHDAVALIVDGDVVCIFVNCPAY